MKKIILYIRKTNVIGGLETFIYNFCANMHKEYDIVVMAGIMHPLQVNRLKPMVKVITGDISIPMECDTLIMMRILDPIPKNIKYGKVIRRIHSCKAFGVTDVPRDGDVTVCVSNAVKNDFNLTDSIVINNLAYKTARPTLLLVSATRIPAPDKGDNEKRMRILARKLEEANIPFLWLNFSDGILTDPPKNFYNLGCRMDIQNYMQKADYVVQLSTVESFGNTVLESLMLNVPLICTPVPAFKDIGVVDGVNAHVVPFNMEFDVRKLLDIPKFTFNYDNERRINQWREIL